MPHELIREHISTDTVEALRQLLEAAQNGQVVGLIFGAILKRRKYMVDCAGEACRDPTLARGIAKALDDELSRLVQTRADSSTTM